MSERLTEKRLAQYRDWLKERATKFESASSWKTIAKNILVDRDRLAAEVDRLRGLLSQLGRDPETGGIDLEDEQAAKPSTACGDGECPEEMENA